MMMITAQLFLLVVAYAALSTARKLLPMHIHENMLQGSYFDRILTIGSTIARDSSSKLGKSALSTWGAWELFLEWINNERGRIMMIPFVPKRK